MDELTTLLSQLNFNFNVMAITENCIFKGKKPFFNFNFENFHEPIHTPTEASVGSSMLDILNNLS